MGRDLTGTRWAQGPVPPPPRAPPPAEGLLPPGYISPSEPYAAQLSLMLPMAAEEEAGTVLQGY